MPPVQDLHARFVRIGHGGFEALKGGSHEAAHELGVRLKCRVCRNDAIAVIVEAGIGVGQAKHFLGVLPQQSVAARQL